MKRILIIINLTIVNVVLFNSNIYAEPFSTLDTTVKLSPGLQEHLTVFTDRTVYATGESCLFAAFRTGKNHHQLAGWNKVLYVELLKPDGIAVVQTKFPVVDDVAAGTIEIPGNLFTGYYYLRAYTRWMRNFGEENFPVVRLKVINPKEPVLQSAGVSATGFDAVTDIEKKLLVQKDIISVKADKVNPGTGENVNITLGINNNKYGLPEKYCISVIRPGATDSLNHGLMRHAARQPEYPDPLRYIPDMNGLSLFGSVVDKTTGHGAGNVQVMLSMLGFSSDFYSYVSLPDGRFVFDIRPFNGEEEFYITLAPGNDEKFEIRIDDEYAGNFHLKEVLPFSLTDRDKKIAQEIVFNSQVNLAYRNFKEEDTTDNGTKKHIYFYGKPVNSIYIDEYIHLTSVKEVLFELVHEIVLVKKKEIFYFKTNGFYTDMEIFKPLILIDNIPVNDFESLLKSTPEMLERIDVIDRIYAKGDYLYGGMLHFISRKGDFGRLTLPENAFFFSFDGFQKSDFGPFDFDNDISGEETRIPDLRNCLYWNPSLSVTGRRTLDFSFRTSDSKGPFLILVRSVADDGTIFEGSCTITVE
ncbi:MAG: hypothetical protein R6W78_00760 [Bacteroidales bacterium]